jgi:ribose transport system permease protein
VISSAIRLSSRLNSPRWLWSYIAAGAAWVAIILVGGNASEAASTALAFAAFTTIASIGQMLVMTVGGGSVDLSIPSAMTLGAVLSMKVMGGESHLIPMGFAAALLSGGVIGLANAMLVRWLRVPPLIATLGSSLVVLSIAIAIGHAIKGSPPAALAEAVQMKAIGFPVVSVIAAVLAILIGVGLERTPLGRTLCATGQNDRAATLAGLPVWSARLAAYILSGALAGFAGALLAAYSGGSSLDLGSGYLLLSIAVVVIGGTKAAGGEPAVAGVVGASLFMFLLVSFLNTVNTGAGVRILLTGLVIIAVVSGNAESKAR